MSVLTRRYSGSAESQIDQDIRRIDEVGVKAYADATIEGQLSDVFWDVELVQGLDTSVTTSPYWHVFRAAQVKLNDKGFLSRDITIRELIEHQSDRHHIFPKHILKKQGMTRGKYNQLANYAITQTEINISISNKPPSRYFQEVIAQCNGGDPAYGNITDIDELKTNFRMNCIPDGITTMTVDDYEQFLDKRRRLMAQKIKHYFEQL